MVYLICYIHIYVRMYSMVNMFWTYVYIYRQIYFHIMFLIWLVCEDKSSHYIHAIPHHGQYLHFAYIKIFTMHACVTTRVLSFSEGLCLTIRRLPAVTSGTSESRCSRVCLAVEGRFWTILGKMKEGTPCTPTEDGYKDGRCIGGSCLVSFQEIKLTVELYILHVALPPCWLMFVSQSM